MTALVLGLCNCNKVNEAQTTTENERFACINKIHVTLKCFFSSRLIPFNVTTLGSDITIVIQTIQLIQLFEYSLHCVLLIIKISHN